MANETNTTTMDFADAYEGAREDLAIWKRRALEAERLVLGMRALIANDAYAISFQTFGQYRTTLLKAIDTARTTGA